jgi:CheY-like chemotaxis protein
MESSYRVTDSQRPLFLVDDDEVDRTSFCRLLRDSSIPNPCRVFAHGEEIIDALIEVLRGAPLPLACFLDVRMPGMNGFDVLRWIRCQHQLDDMAVVMLSSSDEPAHLTEANHFGAQCYLSKFPDAQQLLEIIRAAERAAEAACPNAFKLQCNLLVNAPQVLS